VKYAGRHLPALSEAWHGLNGDIWTRFDLGAMAAYPAQRQAVATIGPGPAADSLAAKDIREAARELCGGA
jgi:hypothetical protein